MPTVVSHDPGTLNAIEMRSSDPGVGVTCDRTKAESRLMDAVRKQTASTPWLRCARYLMDQPAGEEHQVARQRADGELGVERRQRPAWVVKHNAAGVVGHLRMSMMAQEILSSAVSRRSENRLLPELQCASAP